MALHCIRDTRKIALVENRVPDAVQRASRCFAEPGPITLSWHNAWAPDQQRTTPRKAARCAASGARDHAWEAVTRSVDPPDRANPG
jgi:hypothetical protein